MEMQDKEFDKLFSAKLNHFEAEPSRAVWQGINEGLGGNDRKKLIPFLSIAASIIVLVAAGLLFIPKKARVVKSTKIELSNNHPSKAIPATTTKSPVIEVPKTNLIAASTTVNPHHAIKNKAAVNTYQREIPAQQQVTAPKQQQTLLAAADPIKKEIAKAVATDTATKIARVPVTPQQLAKPTTLVAVVPDKEKMADTQPAKKHRIRSFGDVLNVVIAAVDKRKDKIIEFSDTDGDESTITAVNLGIIKVKKEN